MNWSTDIPDMPGFYWTKHEDTGRFFYLVVLVEKYRTGEMVVLRPGSDYDEPLESYGMADAWAGPLVPPLATEGGGE